MTPQRREKLTQVLSKRQFDITVIFENVQDPHNISAVMRTCESAGIQQIHVLNHGIPPHPKFGKDLGFRSSSSAWKWLSINYHDNPKDCIHSLKQQGFKIMATALSEQAKDLYEINFTGKTALVFGNERTGVTPELLALCDGNFLVPQVGIIQSLNISVACAICLYEAFRQKREAGHYAPKPPTNERLQPLAEKWGLQKNL